MNDEEQSTEYNYSLATINYYIEKFRQKPTLSCVTGRGLW